MVSPKAHALMLLLCSLTTAPLAAQAGPTLNGDGTALTGLSAAQLFDLADQARVQGRIADAEAIYRALSRDPKLEIRSEARFRYGQLLASKKRFRDAALEYRAILDEQPEATRVRLELAQLLVVMGDEGRARRELRQAQAAGLPPEVQQVVDRFATALRSNRRFGGNFEFALAPDNNINRATRAETLDAPQGEFVLSPDAREQSGIGAHLTGQLFARFDLGNGLSLVPRVSGDGMFYGKSQFNDFAGSALLGVEWQHGRARIVPSVGMTWRTFGGQAFSRTKTADIRWTHRIGQRVQSDVGFSYGRTRYLRNDLQDGNLVSLSAGVERAVSVRSGVNISANLQRQTARDPQFSTTAGGGTLLGWREMGKTTLFASVTARRLVSDASYFGFLGRRKEWYLRGGGGATFRQIEVAGFSPIVRVSYERNISSVELFDYRRATVDFGITRAF